ncbi:MAG: glycosyltransferase [Flavobacteriales bacterium]|nr:glycosyltransferase [Flavobacteriales bacterium]
MKRVLIITYYWPPNGGVGGQRWLKMCKYLPEHGWQPVVYTPANPEMSAVDEGLLRDVAPDLEVIKRPITEPFSLYKRFTGRAKDERIQTAFLKEEGSNAPGWKERFALWVRSNFFVPDARVWWVRPSVRHLRQYLRDHPVDAVVTTGPPHSMHLIGLGLKRSLGVKWIADFRDPWTGIDYYHLLSLTDWADRRHRRMEREVLSRADQVVSVSWHWAKDLEALGAKNVRVITNGYDRADLPATTESVDERYSLVHSGSMSPTRDQPGLWKLLAQLCASDKAFAERFVLRFIGPVDANVLASVNAAGLGAHVERMGRLTRAEAMRGIAMARVLLLPINTTANQLGILPTKLYEYLSTGRPILAVGPRDGDVARVLGDHLLIAPEPSASDAQRVRALFDAPSAGAADARYDRRVLAGEMARLLDQVALRS